jgi:hypothetical protein
MRRFLALFLLARGAPLGGRESAEGVTDSGSRRFAAGRGAADGVEGPRDRPGRHGRPLLTEYGGEGQKFVRPGQYKVTLTHGKAKSEQKLAVAIAAGIETR